MPQKRKHEREIGNDQTLRGLAMDDIYAEGKRRTMRDGVGDEVHTSKGVDTLAVSKRTTGDEDGNAMEGKNFDLCLAGKDLPSKSSGDVHRPAMELKAVQARRTSRDIYQEDDSQPDWQNWKAKYDTLSSEFDEVVKSRRDEQQLAKKVSEDSKQYLETLRSQFFNSQKRTFRRDFGYYPPTIIREYKHIYDEILGMSLSLDQTSLASTIEKLSQNPNRWEIASLGGKPWIRKLLLEKESSPFLPFFIFRRIIFSYILRWVFNPLLFGLDKEVESLLLRIRDNMESRMSPTVVDKWLGETLYSFTTLPSYAADRGHNLRVHARFLHKFIRQFEHNKPDVAVFAEFHEDDIHKRIVERAANLALEMSVSSSRFEVDWHYCDEKTSMFKRDLKDHELCLLNQHPVIYQTCQNIGWDEKVGDVVMMVRPPIFATDKRGNRFIAGKPLILVEPAPGYDPDPKNLIIG